jgi:trimethylamine--corrinoid protein Co-methyltransferase
LGNRTIKEEENMAIKAFTRRFKPLDILTEEQVQEIHRGTLEVLWETGIRFEHKRALQILEKNGCKVDYDNYRVQFPPGLVEESLRKCPSVWSGKARDPEDNVTIGGSTTYFAPFPGADIVDLDTWGYRKATRKEMYDGLVVLDALETVGCILQYTPYFAFEGVPPAMVMPECMAAKIRSSTKWNAEGFSNDSEIFTIQMAQAVGADMYVPCLPAPPLTYYTDTIEAALRAVEADFPVKVGDGAVYGGTAPATIAGATISNNAELIAPIVLLQCVKPGARILASNFNFPQNMRTGSPAFGQIGIK